MTKKMWFIIAAIVFVLSIWSYIVESQEAKLPSRVAITNIADKPLFIKELTTGVLYDVEKLPKPTSRFQNNIYFNYQYFGKERSATAKVNKKGEIYKIDIPLGLYASELHATIEEKVSSENGRVIRFLCKTTKTDLSAFGYKNSDLLNNECIIRNGSQKLIFKTSTPNGPAAAMDIGLNSASLTLEDNSLIKEDIEKEANERKRVYEETTKKAKSDI